MGARASMVLAAATLAASALPSAAYEPLTIRKGDPPLVVAEAHPDINGDGKPDTVMVALVEGRRYEDHSLWCGNGWKDEGTFSLTVTIAGLAARTYSVNRLLSQAGPEYLQERGPFPAWFRPGPWRLWFGDVTHDGRLEFTLARYGACRAWEYFLFAIDPSGEVSAVRLPTTANTGSACGVSSPTLTLTPQGFVCGAKSAHPGAPLLPDDSGDQVDLECTWDASKGRFDIGEYTPPVITVANHSRWDVCYVLLSPPGAESWGPNRLPRGARIGNEQEWEFQTPEAIIDVMVANCDGTPLEMYRGFQNDRLSIGFDGTPEMQANAPGFEVVNTTDTTVCWDRGDPWVVGPHARRILFLVRPEWHDSIRFYACDGAALETPRWIESTWTFVIGTRRWPPEKATPPSKESVRKSWRVTKEPTPPPRP